MEWRSGFTFNGAIVMRIERPRRNRVNPRGEIEATHHRCELLGNRGDLHDEHGGLGKYRWRHRSWITCNLEYGAKRIRFDRPGSYYPLFFSDEAVAFAAGHRPCGKCRPEAHQRFKEAWNISMGHDRLRKVYSRDIDDALHRDRTLRFCSDIKDRDSLPSGTFVALNAAANQACIVWESKLYRWKWDGYEELQDIDESGGLQLITPPRLVNVLNAGYDLFIGERLSSL